MLEFDHERQHEPDVGARERVVVLRAVRRARVHVDHVHPLVVRGERLGAADDLVELRQRRDLVAEVVERAAP